MDCIRSDNVDFNFDGIIIELNGANASNIHCYFMFSVWPFFPNFGDVPTLFLEFMINFFKNNH